MYRGLQYVGRGNGISVQLYKSYTSVILTWDKSYTFTDKDNTSDEAIAWYTKNYRPLGVRVIEDEGVDNDKPIEAYTEPSTAKDEVTKVEEDHSESAEVEVTTSEDTTANTSIMIDKLTQALEGNNIEEISEEDLANVIESTFSDDEIHSLITELDISKGRTSKRDKLIELIVKKLRG